MLSTNLLFCYISCSFIVCFELLFSWPVKFLYSENTFKFLYNQSTYQFLYRVPLRLFTITVPLGFFTIREPLRLFTIRGAVPGIGRDASSMVPLELAFFLTVCVCNT